MPLLGLEPAPYFPCARPCLSSATSSPRKPSWVSPVRSNAPPGAPKVTGFPRTHRVVLAVLWDCWPLELRARTHVECFGELVTTETSIYN